MNMNQRIIYPNDDGGVAILIPSGEIAIEEVARKDVPAGVAYKIVDVSNIPEDRTFRGAWEADFSNPDGVGIGADAWFAEQASIKAAEEAEQLAQQAQEEVANDNNQPE
jgi:hypothetical protein